MESWTSHHEIFEGVVWIGMERDLKTLEKPESQEICQEELQTGCGNSPREVCFIQQSWKEWETKELVPNKLLDVRWSYRIWSLSCWVLVCFGSVFPHYTPFPPIQNGNGIFYVQYVQSM